MVEIAFVNTYTITVFGARSGFVKANSGQFWVTVGHSGQQFRAELSG